MTGTTGHPRQLARRAELAPAVRSRPGEDERRVRGSGPHASELALAVEPSVVRAFVAVEPYAPAAAEDAVVRLDDGRERVPGRLVERPNREAQAREISDPRAGRP